MRCIAHRRFPADADTRPQPRPAAVAPPGLVRRPDGAGEPAGPAASALGPSRYIGIDTPETVRPDYPVQCFGEAAHAANTKLVSGHQLLLRFDVEQRDRYGRLLAYVWRADDRLFVNAELVRAGYANTMTIPPNVAYADRFRALAAAARAAGRGLWSACDR